MGFLSKLFGYRWSLYFVTNGRELRYAMHEHSVIRMIGYVMSYYANGARPVSPWSVHLNCNKKNESFELHPEHFKSNGDGVTDALIHRIQSIDPDWQVRGAEPVFEEVPSRRRIKIANPMSEAGDAEAIKQHMQSTLSGVPREQTFFDVMDQVFGRERR